MTGRDLIIYILSNGLENEQVFQNGKLLGFITIGEAAAKSNVGVATILAWMKQGLINGFMIGDMVYIPANFKCPIEQL